jgi:4-amino-4-deoxychorismate lyase
MCQLVESLKLEDGKLCHVEYHNERLNRSGKEIFSGWETVDLAEIIQVPEDCTSGIYKVRVLYEGRIQKVEIEPYHFRTIASLRVVRHEQVDYHLKYSDRRILQELFALRGSCDDIIIVKNGFVTDSFAANLLLFDGEKWVTPSTPLLKGTQRRYLLDQKIISEAEIRESDILNFEKIGLVNALVGFEQMPVIPVNRVVF